MGAFFRILIGTAWLLQAQPGGAAPDAALVMDARTGQVLLAENADTPLHPASLTKMMTLYVALAAVQRHDVSLDEVVLVSRKAADTGGSTLYLRAGQRIPVRDLILAVAVRSANDAAVALAEGIAGTEEAFVQRMNATAAAMDLTGTRFENAHGLTAQGHLSSAHDMTVLGRRLLLEFPAYAEIYAKPSLQIDGRTVAHTNRRFLAGYAGADGLKTGYTRAAGFTLTASARRGGKHLMVTIFGASSSEARAAKAARLLDWGFARVPEDVVPVPPSPLRPNGRPGRGPVGLLVAARPLLDADVGAGTFTDGASSGSAALPLASPLFAKEARGPRPSPLAGRVPRALVSSPVGSSADDARPAGARSPGGLLLTALKRDGQGPSATGMSVLRPWEPTHPPPDR